MRSARPGRGGERGSAVVSVLVLLAAALLVAAGARLFGGAAIEKLRCQGDAVRGIGSGSAASCGDGAQRAQLGPAPAGEGSSAPATARPRPRPIGHADPVTRGSDSILAPLFQIVETGFGRTAENQVTEEEFGEAVSLYADVRAQRTMLRPTEQAAPYWDAILADLARILQTEGGRELVAKLAHHVKETSIAVAFRTNEDGEPDPERGLDTRNAFARYDGSAGSVEYAPGQSMRFPDADVELDPWAEMRSDVALFHELRHTLDFLDGTGDDRFVSEDGTLVRVMEYQAVGLANWQSRLTENAYRAARRAIGALGFGAALGDADMPHRPRYTYRLRPVDPPRPRPRPATGDP